MDGDRIVVGDSVSISFTTSKSLFDCTVLSAPSATGDSWILKQYGNRIIYVQLFERMDKIS